MSDMILLMIFAHFLCDFPLQTDKIAIGKCPGCGQVGVPWGYWMAGHCGTHALAVSLVTGIAWLGVAEFVVHFTIDWFKCKSRINLAIDQSLHILCKILWGLWAMSMMG